MWSQLCCSLGLLPQNRVSTERMHVVSEAYAVGLMEPLAATVTKHHTRLSASATAPDVYRSVAELSGDGFDPLTTDCAPVLAVQAGFRYFLSTLSRYVRGAQHGSG